MIRACSPSLFSLPPLFTRRWLWWWFDLYRVAGAQRSTGGADTVGGVALQHPCGDSGASLRSIAGILIGGWRFPFLSSVPMAFIGGVIPIDASIYFLLFDGQLAYRSQLVSGGRLMIL